MKKALILLEDGAGNEYDFQSSLMPRLLFEHVAQTQVPEKDVDAANRLFDEIVEGTGAEWKLAGEETWRKKGWETIPPAVTNYWITELIKKSGNVVEVKVRAEKK